MSVDDVTAEALRQRVEDRFREAIVSSVSDVLRGDHELNAEHWVRPGQTLREAAVLVPLVDRPEGMTVLLTRRTDTLSTHAGQVSFPGGRIEPSDAGPEDAALRETLEEIGLERRFVRVLGHLDPYVTGTGFRITPVVGIVTPGFTLVPDPGEVAAVFEVPLAHVMDPVNHEKHAREWQGVLRHYYVIPHEDHFIWGATAGMLVNLFDRLKD
ncbi:CoA pyrophosphatase [Zavarzinia sp. CC-PAN008]|uniref:CoA pyrophosphatase n=1 Tax=Zavarzinia sp. CC-PAN008 TaxID=3243332 RepID=UPI003F74A11E